MDMRVAPAQVLLAQPRGFCAGVTRAIGVVEQALAQHGAPVYVFHEIVHNSHVVAALRAQGAVFVNDIHAIPAGALTVFSAHGVAPAIARQARARGLRVVDATCPLVTKVHQHAQRYAAEGRTVLVIGHAGHDEVVGTLGHLADLGATAVLVSSAQAAEQLDLPAHAPLAYVTQTTLSVDDTRDTIATLRRRWPAIVGPALADICYATQNRQAAVRTLVPLVDLVLVVGSANSSNNCRLRELAQQQGLPAWLVDDASQIEPAWLQDARRIGVTAGASTPEALVQQVLARLKALGVPRVHQLPGVTETVSFKPPALST